MLEHSKPKRRLLIAEDEIALRDLLVEICSDLDVEIVPVSSGSESLQICLEGQVDAVLSDINMPDFTGLEVLRQIRAQGLETPYVLLSAYGNKANITEAMQLGANDFLDKPFDPSTLQESIRHALGLGQALRQAKEEMANKLRECNPSEEQIQALEKAQKDLFDLRYKKTESESK